MRIALFRRLAALSLLAVGSPGLLRGQCGGAAGCNFTFGPPDSVQAGAEFTIVVAIVDSLGNRVANWTKPVTVAWGDNAWSAVLLGQLTSIPTQVYGTTPVKFASYTIAVDRPGTDFTLVFSSPGLGTFTSKKFKVIAPAGGVRTVPAETGAPTARPPDR